MKHPVSARGRLRSSKVRPLILLIAIPLLIPSVTAMSQQKTFADLTKLFAEWRAFQRPALIGGVPDYSARAMSAQHRELPAFRRRLADIDKSGWPISQQVDWYI